MKLIDEDAARIRAAAQTPSAMMSDTDAGIDLGRMRRYRLGRIREQLLLNGFDACVLTRPISIRYACGSRNYALFSQHLPSAYLFVPVEGPVVLYDDRVAGEVALRLGTVDEWRPSLPTNHIAAGSRLGEWLARWARDMAQMANSVSEGGARLAIESVSLVPGNLFSDAGVEIEDASALVAAAKAIKSVEEILCMNASIAVAEAGMWKMKQALQPGITEQQLWSHLWQTNIANGGDWIECRLLSSGERTNPWLQEAGARIIRAGELVAFDTDMIGPFGYCADISRTWLCPGAGPSPAQRELYQRAEEEISHNLELIRAGTTFQEISERCFRQPAEYIANRYPYVAHGVGMSDEWPGIYYPQDFPEFGYQGALESGMTICMESYVGKQGGQQGVKLEQQVLVTNRGHVLLSRYPLEQEFLD